MKAIVISAFFVLFPCLATAQQTSASPCGIARWSTTGAACEYAPDLSPAKMRVEKSPEQWLRANTLPHEQIALGKQDTSKQKRKYLRRRRLQKPLPPPGGVVKPAVPNPDKMPIIPGDSLTKAQPK